MLLKHRQSRYAKRAREELAWNLFDTSAQYAKIEQLAIVPCTTRLMLEPIVAVTIRKAVSAFRISTTKREVPWYLPRFAPVSVTCDSLVPVDHEAIQDDYASRRESVRWLKDRRGG